MGQKNGIFKQQNTLHLEINRPLAFGTKLTYLKPGTKEVRSGTVVDAGYYCLVVWSDDKTIAIIGYPDILSIP